MSYTGEVTLLDGADGRALASGSSAISGRDVEQIVACADGALFAVARTGSRQIELWTTDPLVPTLLTTTHTRPVEHLAFSPDGRRLASASSAEAIIHALDETEPRAFVVADTGRPVFSPDSSTLYLGTPDGWLVAEPLRRESPPGSA